METLKESPRKVKSVKGVGGLPRVVITIILIVYSFLTILPFYFLFIRSFVPTSESTTFHMWVPENRKFDVNAKIGSLVTFYNIDLEKFKTDIGIEGFINMNLPIDRLAKEYDIPIDHFKHYFKNFYLYNGWIGVLSSSDFYRAFTATVVVTVVSTVLAALLGAATGLGLSLFNRRWQSTIYMIYLLQMVVPGVITLLPSYILVRTLGLTDTYLILVIISICGGALSTMIFTGAAVALPKELYESVKIDGGGKFLYYRSLLLPLIMPAIGAYALITIPQVWNNLLGSLLYNRPDKYLLMAFINSFSGTFSTNYQAIYAGLAVALLPILILYLFLRNFFVKAALAGAVKA